MKLSWGQPTILIMDLDVPQPKWERTPVPAANTTQLNSEEGQKTEALVEGGEIEDIRYEKNKYSLQYNIRAAKNRKKPILDKDGVVTHNYAVIIQPEDPGCSGYLIQLTAVSVQNTYTAADGKGWLYKHDALKLEDDTNMVKDGIVTIEYNDSDKTVKKVLFKPEDEDNKKYSGKTYNLTSTASFTTEATELGS